MESTPLIARDGNEAEAGVPTERTRSVAKGGYLGLRDMASARNDYESLRAYVHDLVEGDFDSWFEYSIFALIIFNVFAFMLGTLIVEGSPPCKGECVTWNDKHEHLLEVFEAFSVAVFTLEYGLRIWSCVEDPEIASKGPFWGRIAYATSFYPMIDLISILPWYLTLLNIIPDVDFTTALRIFRLIRLLKAEKYLNAFSLLGSVLAENGSLLIVTLYYSTITWFVCSTLLYFTERNNPELAEAFSSIPNSMFPTLVMLTGEYPYAEFTTAGKYIAGMIAVIAVAIFAVPTAVIGSGFVQAIQKSRGLEFTVGAD